MKTIKVLIIFIFIFVITLIFPKINVLKNKHDSTNKKIELVDIDGKGKQYTFLYNNETYNAIYYDGKWKVINSYKITDKGDITSICQSLIDVHPIYGKDLVSRRTAEDMAYEWIQHNIAYNILPNDSSWKNRAKDVDLDPEDQGKNIFEMFGEKIEK